MASGLLVFFAFFYFAFLFYALVDYLQLLSVVATAAATTAIIVIVIVVAVASSLYCMFFPFYTTSFAHFIFSGTFSSGEKHCRRL